MITRRFWIAILGVGLFASIPVSAQISENAKRDIIRTIIADQAAARIAMPLGTEGVELSDSGKVDEQKLQQQIRKNGQAIEPGRIVNITDLSFSSDKIELVLDGGGKSKTSWKDHVSVGMGGASVPVTNNCEENPHPGCVDPKRASGSKVTLKFAKKVPDDLTSDQLRQYLGPVLDFTKHVHNAVEALPPEFQEAVKAKEAVIGMDHDAVILSMGRPDNKSTEVVNGVEEETWIYRQRGYHAEFVVFVNNVVVRTKQY
jgi:hypothetical protein